MRALVESLRFWPGTIPMYQGKGNLPGLAGELVMKRFDT